MNIFEEASRLKLRFVTGKGGCTVEALWDLPFKSKVNANLDDVAKTVSRAIKNSGEESFVTKKSVVNDILELKFDIIKHVIAVRLAEKADELNAGKKKARKEKLLAIKAGRADEADTKLSDEALDAELAALND